MDAVAAEREYARLLAVRGVLLALSEHADVAELERVAVELGQSGEHLAVVRQALSEETLGELYLQTADQVATLLGPLAAARNARRPPAQPVVTMTPINRREWLPEPAVEVLAALLEHLPHSRTAGREVRVDQAWTDTPTSLCLIYRPPYGSSLVGLRRETLRPPAGYPADAVELGRDLADFVVGEPLGKLSPSLRPDRNGIGWFGNLADGNPDRPAATDDPTGAAQLRDRTAEQARARQSAAAQRKAAPHMFDRATWNTRDPSRRQQLCTALRERRQSAQRELRSPKT